MSGQADEAWLVTDASKFGRSGFVRVLDLGDLAGIITDTTLPDAAAESLRSESRAELRLV